MPTEPLPGPTWRSAEPLPPADDASAPRWRRESQASDKLRRWRRLRIAALVGAFLVCTGLLVWASLWLFPPQPASLVIVGAGYETNLAVPHNAHGREGMRELAAWAGAQPTSFSWYSGLLKLKPEPVELQVNAPWDTTLDRTDAKTIVLYFSAHGAADLDGPFLLRQDADGRPVESNRLRIREVLARLKKLPAGTNKVVIFDATQIESCWPLGILHNDFARGLEQLDAEIAAVPNLVVLSASAPDQRSWASDELRQTLFSYYVLEGLKGAADANEDGRIDAFELHDFVRTSVERWVRANREAVQTPVLLPAGPTGERLAQHILLTMVPKPYHATDPAPSGSWTPPDELAKAWETSGRLSRQTPPPEAYSPLLWQQHRATLLRYEELLRAGDTDNAATLSGQLAELERQIDQGRRIALTSAGNTLAMAKLAPSSAKTPDPANLFQSLWKAKPDQIGPLLQTGLPADLGARQTVRLQLLERIVQEVKADPQLNIERAAELIPRLDEPAVPRPAEAHFLLLLGRNLPQNPPSAELAAAIALALQVRLQAEQAALGLGAGGYPSSERVWPWIQPMIARADEERALAQDLLFIADSKRWAEAVTRLKKAQALYTEAQGRAEALASAFAVRDRLFAELPAFSRVVAVHRAADGELEKVEELWGKLHALAGTLDGPTDLPTAAVTQLGGDAQALTVAFDALRKPRETRLENSSNRTGLADWYEIDAALAYPSWDPALRMRLLTNQRAIERRLMPQTERNAARVFLPSTEAQKKQTLDRAQRQARLALAYLGDAPFVEVPGKEMESAERLTARVQTFGVNEHWWDSVGAVGDNLGRRWQGIPEAANRLTKESAGADLKDTRSELRRGAQLARLLDGTSNDRVYGDLPEGFRSPTECYRKLLLHDLLLGQAQRTLDDHWFAEDDGAPRSRPYYQEAGRRFTADALALVRPAQQPAATALLARLSKPDRLAVSRIPSPVMTSERELHLEYTLKPEDGTKFRPGFSVFRLQGGKALVASFPGKPLSLVAELKPQEASTILPADIAQNLGALAGSHKETARVTLRGFFRGQIVEEETPVELHPLAAKVYYEYPPPPMRAVAVRTAPGVHQLGDSTGSVVFVLDCSGSMGSDPNNPTAKTKFDETTQALEEVLAGLPRGTTVSLWVFGQAVGVAQTATNAEDTIRRLLEPTAWNPDDKEQLPLLMRRIHALEPWNESPIVQTILQAKGDLDKASGSKAIVVLTDGYDNRFERPDKAGKKKSIATALRQGFKDSGIGINVVGFKFPSKEEEDRARAQFRVLEELTPPGRFYATNEAAKLSADLQLAVRQRLRYWIDREDNEKLRDFPEAGLEPRAGDNDIWFRFPDTQTAAGYKMRVDTDRRVLQNVVVNRGDLLLLNLAPGRNGLDWRRAFVTHDDFGDKPTAASGDWRAALVQNKLVNDRGLQMLLMLDKSPEPDEATVQVLRPRETWVEVEAEGATAPFDLRWGAQPGYAVPAWNVESPEWPTRTGTHTPLRPVVRLWWNLIQETSPDAFVSRAADAPALLDRKNIACTVGGKTVTIESIAVETQRVETQGADAPPGKFEDKRCLVVRVSYPQGEEVRLRVEGIAPAGQEHRYYPEAGKYTAIFWPVDEEQARSALSRINLISIGRFKAAAEKNGHFIKMDRLNEPQPQDPRPRPPLGVKYE